MWLEDSEDVEVQDVCVCLWFLFKFVRLKRLLDPRVLELWFLLHLLLLVHLPIFHFLDVLLDE